MSYPRTSSPSFLQSFSAFLRAPKILCATALFASALLSPASLGAQGLRSTGPTLLKGMTPDAHELDMRTTPIVKAVRRVEHSVVSIYVVNGRQSMRRGIDGQGSGVIIDDSGWVITNWHVIAGVAASPGKFDLQVRLRNGKAYSAKLLSSSREFDLALLQLNLKPGEKVAPVVAGDSDSLMVGETVIAIGNPQGHANTVTAGVLSATNRSINVRAPDGKVRKYSGLLQTDAAINQGNSGGALFDITGKLIGINNAMAVGSENIGFAIPLSTVKRVFQDVLLSSDNLASVWLGFKVADEAGKPIIASLTRMSPGERAGLRKGDVVVEAGGLKINSALDFARSTLRARENAPFNMLVRRKGKLEKISTVPLSAGAWEILRRTGIEVEGITQRTDEALMRKASIAFVKASREEPRWLPVALRIGRVFPNGPGADLGLRKGDLLVGYQVWQYRSLRYRPFASLASFADITRQRSGDELSIVVFRDGEIHYGDLYIK